MHHGDVRRRGAALRGPECGAEMARHFKFNYGAIVIDSLIFISFLFLGHSNMGGVCAAMDTVPNPHVWMLGKLGLINCTDKDFPRTTGTSGSMVMPFLKRMALLYPGYNFIGERYAGPCNKTRDLFQETPHREHIKKVIKELKEKSTIGGVILMHGFIEGLYSAEIDSYDMHVIELAAFIRDESGNKELPVLVARYEKNGDSTSCWENKEIPRLVEKIESLPKRCAFMQLYPVRYVPRQYFCDNHHYSADGYRICGEDAAAIIQLNSFDFWKGNK